MFRYNKMHSTNLESASGDFQKSFKNLKKCVILKVRKKSTIIYKHKWKYFMFFQVG